MYLRSALSTLRLPGQGFYAEVNGHVVAGDSDPETWSAVLTAFGPLTPDGTTIIAAPGGWWQLEPDSIPGATGPAGPTGPAGAAGAAGAPGAPGSLSAAVFKTANYTVQVNDHVIVDLATAGANLTMTLVSGFAADGECIVQLQGEPLGWTCTVTSVGAYLFGGIGGVTSLVLGRAGDALRIRRCAGYLMVE